MSVKTAKADDGEGDGTFEALVATYDLDSVGDMIVPGAFAETISDWAARAKAGQPLPVIWSHMHHDPSMHIGWVIEAKETDDGLWIKGQLDLEAPAPNNAGQVYRLLKGGRVAQFSFAYDVLDGAWIDRTEDGEDQSYYELQRLKLYEVGPTLIGANQNTELLGVKSAAGELDVAISGLSAKESKRVASAVRAAIEAATKDITCPNTPNLVPAADPAPAPDLAALLLAAGEALTAAAKAVPTTPAGTPAETPAAPAAGPADDQSGQPAPPTPTTEAPSGGKAAEGPTGSASDVRLRTELALAELDLLIA